VPTSSAATTTFPDSVPLGACRYLTADIARTTVPRAVHKVTDLTLAEKGMSLCLYGDEPDPKLLSLNTIDLDQRNSAALRAAGLNGREAVEQATRESCVPAHVQALDASSGIAPWAEMCLRRRGPVQVARTFGPDAYVLSTYALGDKRDVASRFKDLEAAARAIVNAMPR